MPAQGRYDKALSALNEALRHQPRDAILNNRVGLLLVTRRVTNTEATARRALVIAPNDAATHPRMALSRRGRGGGALASVDRAARQSGRCRAHQLEAQIEESLGRFDARERDADDGVVRPAPRGRAARYFQARVEQQRGHVVDATAAWTSCSRSRPGYTPALTELLFLRKELADWHDLSLLQARFRDGVAAGAPGCRHSASWGVRSTRRAEALRAAVERGAPCPHPAAAHPAAWSPAHRLPVGGFRQHATAVLTAGLFQAPIVAAAPCSVLDGRQPWRCARAPGRSTADRSHGWPARQAAAPIAADRVDILVDLNGNSSWRVDGGDGAAPCCRSRSATWAIPGPPAPSFIDYIIGDSVVTPFDHAADYTEKLVLLPGSYPRSTIDRAGSPRLRHTPSWAFPEGGSSSAASTRPAKLNPGVLDTWARILDAVPHGVLWLLCAPCRGFGGGTATREPPREAAGAPGIDGARVIFAARRPLPEYLRLYRRADLFLEYLALQRAHHGERRAVVGCPVLTMLGETFAGTGRREPVERRGTARAHHRQR